MKKLAVLLLAVLAVPFLPLAAQECNPGVSCPDVLGALGDHFWPGTVVNVYLDPLFSAAQAQGIRDAFEN